jgi:DNA-binding MarR family transcriptional regulator
MDFKTLLLEVIKAVDREPAAIPYQISPELSRLTFIQVCYLEAIGRAGRTMVSQLAKEFKVTKPTVSVAVDKLVDTGLVVKKQSEDDGRVYDLRLSARGRKLYRIYRAYDDRLDNAMVERIRNKLSAEDEKKLTEILARLLEAL